MMSRLLASAAGVPASGEAPASAFAVARAADGAALDAIGALDACGADSADPGEVLDEGVDGVQAATTRRRSAIVQERRARITPPSIPIVSTFGDGDEPTLAQVAPQATPRRARDHGGIVRVHVNRLGSAAMTPKSLVRDLVRAWERPAVDVAPDAMLAPVVRIHELLVERGYDAALHRARTSSESDPFALHLGIDRLARSLLLGSKVGRPKILADVVLRFLPPRAKLPRPIADLVRAASGRTRDAYPAVADALGTPALAEAFDREALTAPLAGKPADRAACAERVAGIAREEMTMWYYPFLSRPELLLALADGAAGSALDSPVREAVVNAIGALRRYVVDVRSRVLLVESLASPSADVRASSASALLAAAEASAWPKERWAPVIALLDDHVSAVRERVSSSLLRHRQQLDGRERDAVADRWEAHLADRAQGVRIQAIVGLAAFRGRAFLKQARTLEKAEKNATVRRVLSRAVAELASG